MIVDNLIITWRYTQDEFPVGRNTAAHSDEDGVPTVFVNRTHCVIKKVEDKTILFSANVGCNSQDNYDKETGRRKALTNAIDRLPRETRTKIWEAYRTLGKTPRW